MSWIKVWDPLVRIMHWSLVIAFATAYISEGEPMQLHSAFGYLILGIVALRIIWGFSGSRYARFSEFVRSPRTAFIFLLSELKGDAKHPPGHNPAGGWMVLALLASLLATGVLGVLLLGAEGGGPLSGMVTSLHAYEDGLEEAHEIFANLTLLLVVVHVSAVLLVQFLSRQPLIGAMWHGFKRHED